ncbi:MAG: deoxyhypusine synthase, partial [Halothiobacillaceae bacterium]
LVAHEFYERVPHYRALTAEQEVDLFERGMNRVTDTCIPEEAALRKVEHLVTEEWLKADRSGETCAPHEFLWRVLHNKQLQREFQIEPRDSWLIAAMEKQLPIFTPGWEDSTLGNMFTAKCIEKRVENVHVVESGIQTMMRLADWYSRQSATHSIGFFQIGGGIAGDFPICVVPMLTQDLRRETRRWGYFCQISDSTTSYGSYSGAVPNEKITWGKLDIDTPKFVIESDATIVVPLIFAQVLGW